jgi:hypothetical protein
MHEQINEKYTGTYHEMIAEERELLQENGLKNRIKQAIDKGFTQHKKTGAVNGEVIKMTGWSKKGENFTLGLIQFAPNDDKKRPSSELDGKISLGTLYDDGRQSSDKTFKSWEDGVAYVKKQGLPFDTTKVSSK